MLVSKYIVKFFKSKKIKKFFVFQGGAIMNIIHQIGSDKSLKYLVPHHEQSLSMQVDTAARLNGYGVGMVTSGPGATNILTGVCSAYYDSVPCFFITGQVGQIHIKKNSNYRQLGFQETDVVSIFKSVTKYAKQIQNKNQIKYELEKAYQISLEGRPGPVLLDIPFNIQNQNIEIKKNNKTLPYSSFLKDYKSDKYIKKIIEKITKYSKKSKKVLFLIGGGIKNSKKEKDIIEFLEKNKLPFVLTWTSFDTVSKENRYYLGCIGKNGHRSANNACAEADLIITLGQRFAVKNIFGNFAKKAKIIAVDLDKQEIKSNILDIKLGINLDLDTFYKKILKKIKFSYNIEWIEKVFRDKKSLFDINVVSNKSNYENLVNPFIFFNRISSLINKNYILHCDIGAHETWFFQSFYQKKGQKIINHCGHGAMGHSICSAISANFLNKKTKNIAFIGDGGFMMNLQELNLINHTNKNIKIVVLNNSSLGNTFLGSLNRFKKTFGSEKKFGYHYPDIKSLTRGFKLKYYSIKNNKQINDTFKEFINFKKSAILDVKISKFQPTAELHTINSDKKEINVDR